MSLLAKFFPPATKKGENILLSFLGGVVCLSVSILYQYHFTKLEKSFPRQLVIFADPDLSKPVGVMPLNHPQIATSEVFKK
jgi:hypothetical protein